MLQTEFKELMGLKEITEEQYTQADKIYLACDLDKKTFCHLYEHCSAEAIFLLDNIATLINEKNRYITQLSGKNTRLEGKLNNLAEVALEHYNSALEISKRVSEDYAGAFEEDARMFFDIASQLGGYKEVVLMCLDKGYPLLKDEREYIINEMKG